jgi:hypothetical protein
MILTLAASSAGSTNTKNPRTNSVLSVPRVRRHIFRNCSDLSSLPTGWWKTPPHCATVLRPVSYTVPVYPVVARLWPSLVKTGPLNSARSIARPRHAGPCCAGRSAKRLDIAETENRRRRRRRKHERNCPTCILHAVFFAPHRRVHGESGFQMEGVCRPPHHRRGSFRSGGSFLMTGLSINLKNPGHPQKKCFRAFSERRC